MTHTRPTRSLLAVWIALSATSASAQVSPQGTPPAPSTAVSILPPPLPAALAGGKVVLRQPSGAPRLVTGLSLSLEGGDVEAKARAFITRFGADLSVAPSAMQVDAVEGRSVRLRQVHDGRLVQGATLTLRFDAEGPAARLIHFNNETRRVRKARAATISVEQARALAAQAVLGPQGKLSAQVPVSRLWMPLSLYGGEFVETFEILVATTPASTPERVLVDGEQGSVIGRKPAGGH